MLALRPRIAAPALLLALALSPTAGAQEGRPRPGPPSGGSLLGDPPGVEDVSSGAPTEGSGIVSGRLGPSVPRVPPSVTRPGGELFGLPEPLGPTDLLRVPEPELPLYGPLSLPDGDEEGPPGGLTLDAAIERLLAANLELRAKAGEIPKARADVLTAGLRANPLLYYDTQLIPYGRYTDDRPGGPTQYDLNVTVPIDWNRKRLARVDHAERAARVVEAQFQDAVRLTIDELYRVYVDALAARDTVRYARAAIVGLEQLLELTEVRRREGEVTQADVTRVQIQLESARLGLAEAEAVERETRRPFGPLLNIPPPEALLLKVRGSIRDRAPLPPAGPDLVALAIQSRPDLAAYRLGLKAAHSGVNLARAERFEDVFLLYQPYTFQDLSPFNVRSAHSWGVGVTVPLPVFNRNQGNIARARVNVGQTRLLLAQQEQLVAAEVGQSEDRYRQTRLAVDRIERDLLPQAEELLEVSRRRYLRGDADLIDLRMALREYQDLVRQYRDTLIRHRRTMLDLNTAVGRRILP